ncbi:MULTISPECIES: acyltransferase family protein [unclassified Cyanobium]|uniref:acyltransferase family protein n=1 Tax=unclassified Cyanobium TaxID=2627006 RepID=UPI0020CD104E|nr:MULTISPECIES: acyltransferase family protein [unclassified Cyanobium]MCP9833710.1 acyltransferase [Cyanobium sp. La Preciosa 7G6]MCP9936532.1 acyltransferase [Cyanobium sp. Aljojuca 7A6]
MKPLVGLFGAGIVPPQRSRAYRPEIDGLRAVAVIAVLINHLDPRWLPGGFLGVDIFFVISGYVVTSSLLARRDGSRWQFLRRFYGRRIRRLMPALVVNIAVVSALFSMVVSPLDDFFAPVMRTGMAALFGVSNLYLLRQGSNYFATDNYFNAFMHTWSLGVEEQFYLVWPAVLLLCGLGVAGAGGGALRRLKIGSLLLLGLSLALFLGLSLRGNPERAFFLTTARFWELTAGCGAYLLHRGSGSAQDLGQRLSLPRWRQPLSLLAALALLVVLMLPEAWRMATTLGITALTAALLLLLRPSTGLGRWLCHPVSLAIGMVSYSLYLWHWPVIVLARWTVGFNALTLLPVLVLITLCTALSYRLECLFRYGNLAIPGLGRPGLAYPAITVLAAVFSAGLQGPLLGKLFLGKRSHTVGTTANMKRIGGTTVDTVHCFQEPTDPIARLDGPDPCTATAQQDLPTLFFLGDSHTHVLIPLGEKLLASGRFNVAFMARGGCPVPFFSRWGEAAPVPPRYRRCRPYADNEVRRVLARLRPADRVVLVSNLAGYLSRPKGPERLSAEASYAAAVRQLDGRVRRRGAELVLFGPLPTFPQKKIGGPLTLCQPEWFRPAWSLGPQCQPVLRPRRQELAAIASVQRLQERISADLPGTRLFSPFDSLCPPEQQVCASVRSGTLLYSDETHLTNAGALLLYPRLMAFLADQPEGEPPPS